MVSDTSLWTQRYESPKYGLEPKASLKYFQQYLDLTFPRSIRELCRTINEDRAKNNSKTQLRESTLYNYSCKYDWAMREEAHDEYYTEIHEKAKRKSIEKWESKELKRMMRKIDKHHSSFNELHCNKEIPINKKVYAESASEETYGMALDNLYKIRFGGIPPKRNINSTTLDADISAEADINQKISNAEVKAEMLAELKARMDTMDYD